MSIDNFLVGCRNSKCVSSEFFFCGSRVSHGTINSSFSDKESNLGPSEYTLGKLEEKYECPLHKVEAVTFRIESFRFKDEKEYGCEIFSKTSACKPASFWREKRDTVVILLRRFAKCCVKINIDHGSSFGIFRSAKRLSYQQ